MTRGVSVIICCYNSAARLPVTIQHLLDQQVAGTISWEIVIVDNASTDNTYELAFNLLNKGAISYQVVRELNPGLANARLKGYDVSKYEDILFCDDDNHLASNYVQDVFDTMQGNDLIGILGGKGEAIFEGDEPAWFQKYSRNFAVGDQSSSLQDISKVDEVYGAGCAMRRSFLVDLYRSGFKSLLLGRTGNQITSGDDTELCFMARFLGYEVWYNRRLTFKHLMTTSRMNWKYMKKLYAGFGRMNIYIQAYRFIEANKKIPGLQLKLPLWLDTFIHKAKDVSNEYPSVAGKMNQEGDEEVLRFIAMKAEAREVWRLKENYLLLYERILSYAQNARV